MKDEQIQNLLRAAKNVLPLYEGCLRENYGSEEALQKALEDGDEDFFVQFREAIEKASWSVDDEPADKLLSDSIKDKVALLNELGASLMRIVPRTKDDKPTGVTAIFMDQEAAEEILPLIEQIEATWG